MKTDTPILLVTDSGKAQDRFIPYGRQSIDEADIAAVCEVLRSDWLTTGPKVAEFEKIVADFVSAKHAVAVSNGTAALHCAMYALNIGPGDEVIVPPMTFAATANCVLYQGGIPVFADVRPDTLLIDPEKVEKRITPKTKAVIAVDYAGQPCDYNRLRGISRKHGLALVADGCHAIGATYKGRQVGSLADLTVFSFHPVKHVTTGEGGMITTDNAGHAERMRMFRNHGITTDHRQREARGSWFYEMMDLGFNYRITDFQCALGISQLKKLPSWIVRRQELAGNYDAAFAEITGIIPLAHIPDRTHAYHLYVVRLGKEQDRTTVFQELRARGVGVNVHYVPVHRHPYYRRHLGTCIGQCPTAEAAYERIISLPIYPGMTDRDQAFVIDTIKSVVSVK